MKEYGQSLTTAEFDVREGELEFETPSFIRTGRKTEKKPWIGSGMTFNSRLKLEGGFDPGLSWQTTLGPVEYHLTYFLFSDDIVGMGLKNKLTNWSNLDLTYRTSLDDKRVIAALRFPLP